MKKIILIAIACLCIYTVNAQENETTTYYLIRHAEKSRVDKTNRNPELIEKGLKRAANWSIVLKNVDLDLVYSTNYNRTIQTATPTAKAKNVSLSFYDPRNMYDEKFKLETKGKKVLVVGHSNTTPQFVNKILGKETYKDIDDLNNSNLYIVTVTENSMSDVLLKIDIAVK